MFWSCTNPTIPIWLHPAQGNWHYKQILTTLSRFRKIFSKPAIYSVYAINFNIMKRTSYILTSLLFAAAVFSSCKKGNDFKNLYKAVVPVSSPISDAGCLVPAAGASSVSIKGTMLAGKTYNICGNVLIN